jgi:hypothetical protein
MNGKRPGALFFVHLVAQKRFWEFGGPDSNECDHMSAVVLFDSEHEEVEDILKWTIPITNQLPSTNPVPARLSLIFS